MPTETTPTTLEEVTPKGRLLFGLIPGGLSGFGSAEDTTENQVSPRVARDVQWEVARRWGVDPDRVRLRFGLVSGSVPARISAVRILGTGSKGHWVALLAPSNANLTPARVRVRAGVERLEPVAGSSLTRGSVLRSEDIVYESAVVWGSPRSEAPRVEPGWVVHRQLRKGEALKEPAVSAPDAVKSGREVEIVWKRGAVAVSMTGVALGSGPVGAEVSVRTETGRQLRGVAQESGIVVVGAALRPSVR
ncbi:MAG: flagellar basal body P-ring formation chaperone FlgA [Longimicrobiales bacterium]